MGMSFWYLVTFIVGTFLTYSISTAEGTFWPLVVWVVGYLGAYVASLYLHPKRPCWMCKGNGRHRGFVFRYATRTCVACGGKPRLRWGARMLHIPATSPRRDD